jgi:hypothetical protein
LKKAYSGKVRNKSLRKGTCMNDFLKKFFPAFSLIILTITLTSCTKGSKKAPSDEIIPTRTQPIEPVSDNNNKNGPNGGNAENGLIVSEAEITQNHFYGCITAENTMISPNGDGAPLEAEVNPNHYSITLDETWVSEIVSHLKRRRLTNASNSPLYFWSILDPALSQWLNHQLIINFHQLGNTEFVQLRKVVAYLLTHLAETENFTSGLSAMYHETKKLTLIFSDNTREIRLVPLCQARQIMNETQVPTHLTTSGQITGFLRCSSADSTKEFELIKLNQTKLEIHSSSLSPARSITLNEAKIENEDSFKRLVFGEDDARIVVKLTKKIESTQRRRFMGGRLIRGRYKHTYFENTFESLDIRLTEGSNQIHEVELKCENIKELVL